MYDIEMMTIPETIEQAIKELMDNPEAKPICGGSDILVAIREGKLAGCSLVCIRDIPELSGIRMEEDGTIVIGPAETFSQVTNHPLIKKHIPVLSFAADQAGGPQLRNIGTIGGNICNGVTSADTAPTLLTLNAELEITGPGGIRRVAQEDFYEGPGRVKLEKGELLTAVRIKKEDYEGYTGHYIKYAMRNAMDIATLGCAVHVKMEDNKIADVRLAFGVAAPTPIRCPAAEAAVIGRELNEDTLQIFAETALTQVKPRTSWRASKEFRTHLVSELSMRALRAAAGKGDLVL